MSYTIENLEKVHSRQVAAVESFQAFLIKAVDGLTSAQSKAPKAPKAPVQLTDAVQKVAAPFARVVGTPDEVQAYAAASSRDWMKVQHKFQSSVLDAVFPPATVEVSSRAAKKKA